jgi:hypothetical protein
LPAELPSFFWVHALQLSGSDLKARNASTPLALSTPPLANTGALGPLRAKETEMRELIAELKELRLYGMAQRAELTE